MKRTLLSLVFVLAGVTLASQVNQPGSVRVNGVEASSGAYTPTFTNLTNIAAPSVLGCVWSRAGNGVTGHCRFIIDTTAAAGTMTFFSMSLPVTTNFAATLSSSGGGTCMGWLGSGTFTMMLTSPVSGSALTFSWPATTASPVDISCIFQYRVM